MKATTGKVLKERGMALALDHAGDVWKHAALLKVREWSAGPGRRIVGGLFAFEDVREWATEQGLAPPPSSKAWGGIAQAAVRAGIIKPLKKYRPATSPATHGHPVRLYRVKS